MHVKEIEKLKKELNNLLEKENINTEKVIALSQKLDIYIVAAQRERLGQIKN